MNYLKDVSTLEYKSDKCIGCMKCIEVCPREVLKVNFDKIQIETLDNCIECGGCQMNCPTDALQVNAGVGCALAIMSRYFRNSKWLKPLASKNCC